MQKIYCLTISIIIGIGALQAQDKQFDIIKNMEIFANVYKELNQKYVDEIDPSALMKTGIDAMMHSLDPYTVYYSSSVVESSRIDKQGKYEGIGILVKYIEPYTVITEVTEGGPADNAGLKIADQILEINNVSVVNSTAEEVNRIMQGAPGTNISFKVKRPGTSKDVTVNVSRDQYNVSNVPVYELVDGDIAYVKLTTFTNNAGNNIKKAIVELKNKEPNLAGVILDLRYNGGGLLREAVAVSNVFIPKGKEIVSTRGKIIEDDRTIKSKRDAYDADIPLVVLINHRSASASEIVSGVMQDYDRAVLIGQSSYGKGLVQNFSEVGFNSQIKLTTAKYYIPSGRCIQSVEYDNGEPVDIPLDRRSKFTTAAGRTVYDGGGVFPDVKMEAIKQAPFVEALVEQNIIFDYVTQYMLENHDIADPDQFSFNNYNDFEKFVGKTDFHFEKESEKQLLELKNQLSQEDLNEVSQSHLAAIEKLIDQDKSDDFNQYKNEITELIEDEIILRKYYEKGKIRRNLDHDLEIKKAIEILKDPKQYKKILS